MLSRQFQRSLSLCALLSRFSSVKLFATLRTVARQAPLSMGFSRHEYWSGLPFPTPGIPGSSLCRNQTSILKSPALAGGFFICLFFTTGATWEAQASVSSSAIWE